MIKIDPSERWIFLGKTGSGKTVLVKHFLREVSKLYPVVIIDPKEFWLGKYPKWGEKKELGTIDKPRLIDTFNPKWRVQCLQPSPEDPLDDRLERLCWEVLKRGDIFLYFDETENIATAHNVPRHISGIWKTGRAKNVGAWVSTQAPSGIPMIMKSQAEHIVALKVGHQDVDLVSELVQAPKDVIAGLQKYQWMYYNVENERASFHPPVPYEGKKHA